MAGSTLTVKDLHVSIDGKEILKGVNLEVKRWRNPRNYGT